MACHAIICFVTHANQTENYSRNVCIMWMCAKLVQIYELLISLDSTERAKKNCDQIRTNAVRLFGGNCTIALDYFDYSLLSNCKMVYAHEVNGDIPVCDNNIYAAPGDRERIHLE